MRISFASLLICLIFINCASNNSQLTDLSKMGLIGNVKYVKTNTLLPENDEDSINDKNAEQETRIDREYFFNDNGMISEQRNYSPTGLAQKFVFKYDKDNHLISKEYFNPSNKLVMKSNFETQLNSKGQLSKQIEYRAIKSSLADSIEIAYQQTPYETLEFSYGINGELSQMTYIQSVFGPEFPKIEVNYKDGMIDTQSTIDPNGTLVNSNEMHCMELDKSGNCIRLKTVYDNNNGGYIDIEIEYYK